MNAADKIVKKWLDAQLPNDGTEGGYVEDQFDPWDDLGLYGGYSSGFDDMAIAVLIDMRDGTYLASGLSVEMFRELLCVKRLCEYGTSPRCCWAFGAFRDALPAVIAKWETLRAIRWG